MGGFPNFGYLNKFRSPAPHQLFKAQGGNLPPSPLGPPGFDRYTQYDSSLLYKQGGALSLSLLHLVVDFFNWLQIQDIVFRVRHTPGCLNVIVDGLSRPNQPIPTEWSLNPEIVNRIFQFLGDSRDGHVCVSPPLPPTSVHVGEINVHVSADSSAQQDNSEASGHPSSRSDTNGSLMAVTAMVPTPTSTLLGLPTIFPYRRDLLSQESQEFISDGKLYHLHAWRLSCDTTKQQDFQMRSLGLPKHLGDPQPIICTTTGGFASLTGPQGKNMIRLIPQLLR